MNYLVFFVFLGLILTNQSYAQEISLIDSRGPLDESSRVKEDVALNQEEIYSTGDDNNQEDSFEQIGDFIKQENEKLKDIKLLNLDLEKAGLQLKKKEIEQKMSQLNKTDGTLPSIMQENERDIKANKPEVKLIGVFESALKKEAMLSINGVHMSVKEGQIIEGMTVKEIKSQAVSIQYLDGQIQEAYLL